MAKANSITNRSNVVTDENIETKGEMKRSLTLPNIYSSAAASSRVISSDLPQNNSSAKTASDNHSSSPFPIPHSLFLFDHHSIKQAFKFLDRLHCDGFAVQDLQNRGIEDAMDHLYK